MAPSTPDIVAPIFDFTTEVDDMWFGDMLRLRRAQYAPTKRDERFCLAGSEIGELKGSSHLLELTAVDSSIDLTEIINTFLISLSLQKPSKAQVRFEFLPDGFSRHMTRFQFNSLDEPETTYSKSELEQVSIIYKALVSVLRRRGRLHSALSATYHALSSFNAGPAIVEIATALEALVTYRRGQGLTHRIATACAGICATSEAEARKLYPDFKRVYNARSDFVHGRSYPRTGQKNLEDLALSAKLMRRVWRAIISEREGKWMKVLERPDPDRAKDLECFEDAPWAK